MKRQIVFSIFFLLSYSFIQAQNVSKETIQWNATGFKDLDTNETVTNSCQFVTYGAKKIKWIQDNGKFVVDWNITKSSGTWTNVSQPGLISFSFTDDKVKGELTIKKEGSGWLMNLTISGGPSDFNLRYAVSSIERLD